MQILLFHLLFLLTFQVWAKSAPPTNESMESLMLEARDPLFKADRKKYLQLAQTHMQQKLAQQLKTTTDKLSIAFLEDQSRLNILWSPEWSGLQAEFYTTLHQQVLQENWEAKTVKKKVTEYGKNISEAMFYHLSQYSPVKEGQSYTRWNEIPVHKAGKTTQYRIPSFVFAKDINKILGYVPHTPYEKLFPKESKATPGNPSLTTFLKNAGQLEREEYQTLAEKIQLNHRIYIRAVANSAKTIASIHYLTGEYSYTETVSKVDAFIDGFCDGCSLKEKEDYKNSAIAYVIKTKKSFSQTYSSSKDVVNSFCTDLIDNNYRFDEPETNPAALYQKPSRAYQDNTRVNQSHIYAQNAMVKINALKKTIQEHDLGVLFLTHGLTRLSSTRSPIGTNLGCRPETLAWDMAAVSKAITEARKNVEQYIVNINNKVLNSTVSLKSADDTLEYFTQTNISATSEAVMTYPIGMGHVLDSVLQLDRDVRKRKRLDNVVAWGGTIIGVTLAVSGIGAPEGVVILLAVGAMAKGVILGAHDYFRAQQEKEFKREMTIARRGLGTQFYLDDNQASHYANYRNLRISYILEFAGAIISFAKIHNIALERHAGSIPKAHGFLKTNMQKLKVSGKTLGVDQLRQELLQTVIN